MQTLYWRRTVITFQDNQVPVKGPQFPHKDFFNIDFKLKIKQHLVITNIINLEIASCSPKWPKSMSHRFNIDVPMS